MQTTKKNDFIEIEFTGKVKDGEIFDTNLPEQAKKIGLELDNKPTVICLGHSMVIEGLDNELQDKELNKDYSISVDSKKAFGERKRELIRLIPKYVFTEKKINPQPGMTLALDQTLVRIVSVSGGRVLVDFNNPLAGKQVVYDFKIKKIVEDVSEKVQGILDFFLKDQQTKFEIKDNQISLSLPDFYQPLIDKLNEQFKEILDYEFVLDNKKQRKNDN
jgi:peptidylprolyl isomerase